MARRSARKAAQVVLVARPSPPDAAGARQRQTLRAGSIWLKSFGFRLGRGATTTFTETLDLEPNGLRQSDPVFTGNALGPFTILRLAKMRAQAPVVAAAADNC